VPSPETTPGCPAGSSSARELDRLNLLNQPLEGDCLERLNELPDRTIDLVVCDLPFGTTQNGWDSEIDLDLLWKHYSRVVKPGAPIILHAQGSFTARLILSNAPKFKYKMVWVKSKPTNFLNARRQPLRQHEDICVFYDKSPTYNPQMQPGKPYSKGVRKDQQTGSYGDFDPVLVASAGERFPTDVIYHKTAESEGPVWHSTQKPLGLVRYLIATFSNPGDVVLDNAFGSGTTLVAAVAEGRNFVGIELNRDITRFKDRSLDLIHVARERIVDQAATDTKNGCFLLPTGVLKGRRLPDEQPEPEEYRR